MVLLVSASEDSDAVGGGWTGRVTRQVESSASQTALDPGKGTASSMGKQSGRESALIQGLVSNSSNSSCSDYSRAQPAVSGIQESENQ